MFRKCECDYIHATINSGYQWMDDWRNFESKGKLNIGFIEAQKPHSSALSMGKEKGRKSVAAVKAKTKRRRLRKKNLLRLHANQQITPLNSEECPSNGDAEEAAVDSEQEDLKDDRLFKDFVRYVKAKADVKKYSSGHVVNTVDGIVKRHVFLTEPYKF